MSRVGQQLVEEQDQHLDEINEIAKRLKQQGKLINKELDIQKVHIEDANAGIDEADKKLNFVQAKLGKLLKTNDMGQICTIVILFLILVVMIFLVIYT